ncbi:cytochrome-c oxidase, cbb3-type subunit III [Pseudooctadecabacter jejudonensis]|uniref:Cbb3-type cytochrome c oxidase subunit n=1 Tax=Pseudooctadecabacter jejudonensis TaxID=1391910 RepID=A0A1Y5SZG8_9RHOB|nr:cytochrome-c oxidase, cbb3-type subunit III [Pseudooctadecabacter jejudonensis]SLN48654.1 Cbb3-type cytochrome c oxidase subunit CcoP [Pseudooctadecabacter jejudonensis]
MDDPRIDDLTGRETMGHEFDGIEELNTPMPRWWLITFYLTIVWGIGYTIAFPAWPMISGATAGLLGYATREEVAQDIADHDASNAALVDELLAVDLAAFDPQSDLHRYAVARGGAVFRAQCSQCHGSGAAGAIGFPNLLDNDWLWGGDLPAITYSITHGIRNETDLDAHWSQMPAYGDMLATDEIEQIADFLPTLASANNDTSAPGAVLFADNCAACHGDAGLGNRDMGAPNLADAIWLYGGDRDDIIESITNARFGVMPAWGQRLSEEDVRAVATYVHSLGGGE